MAAALMTQWLFNFVIAKVSFPNPQPNQAHKYETQQSLITLNSLHQ